MVARGPVFCGYTPHLTQFGVIPKTSAIARNGDQPVQAIEFPNELTDGESSGLPVYAIALIVVAALCFCIVGILCIALLLRRRNRAAKPTRATVKPQARDADVPLQSMPRSSTVNDQKVTNPAFGPDSGRGFEDAVVEEIGDSSLESLSEAGDGRATLNMGAYQTLRNATLAAPGAAPPARVVDEPVERNQPTSIIDMDTYKTLTASQVHNNNNNNSNNGDRTAIDAAIFSALESDDSSSSLSSS